MVASDYFWLTAGVLGSGLYWSLLNYSALEFILDMSRFDFYTITILLSSFIGDLGVHTSKDEWLLEKPA